ncbi:MAG TPA: TolC family protein [Terriglobia bacterium]|nr:TolC family protein [Terriglobia bacterium]
MTNRLRNPVWCGWAGFLAAAGVLLAPAHLGAQQPAPASTSPGAQAPATDDPQAPGPALTLDDLEKMALDRNPTLAEAEADVRASAGRKTQSGLYPNPVIGYEGREITGGAVYRGGEHGFFIRQPIVTGGKLGLSRHVFGAEEEQAKSVAAAQRERVATAVRLAYYQALGAQEELEVKTGLADLAHRAAATAIQLANVGQADQPDVLEAKVEAGRAELDLLAARAEQERVWQQLAAVVGRPGLPPSPLAGRLDAPAPQLDRDQALAAILNNSPEVLAAQQGVARAEWVLKRARAERLPDVELRGGADYNRELLGVMNRAVGWEGEAEVGVQIPIFNRNQGNVRAAEAELAHDQNELERVRLALRSNFAALFRDYADAGETARRYRDQMLPDAEKAFELYQAKYREMAAAYPQVLIAQRTLLQLRDEYTRALVSEWESAVTLQGYLLTDGLAAPLAAGEPASLSPGVEVRPSAAP